MPDVTTFPMLSLAQGNGAPALPLDSAPSGGVADTTAASGSASGGAAPGGGNLFMLFAVLVVGMLIFTIYAQRRDSKRRERLIGSIKKHDKVQTIGGVIGSVVEVKGNTVVLKVDESSNTRITFARSAIAQVLTESIEPAA